MKSFLKRVLLFGIIFFAINYIFDFFYGMSNRDAIKNNTHVIFNKWEDIHLNKDEYDLIILGSSRAFTGYNPKILDSVLGTNSYNMGTPSQDIAETYYALKEILCYQKPKVIIIDNFIESIDKNISYYPILSNASFMKCKKNKYDMIIEGFGMEGIANQITPILKYKNHIKNDFISILKKKDDTQNKNLWYKGFEIDSTIISPKKLKSLNPIPNLSTTNVDIKKFKYYFSKILNLTKSNNISLIAVRTPYPPQRMKISDGDNIHEFYSNYYKSKDVSFIDFNKMERDIKIKNKDFSDFHHLNIFGAKKVTLELSKILTFPVQQKHIPKE